MKRRILTGVVLVLLVLVVGASAAGAHAEIVATSPASGSVVDESPGQITLEFTEPVEVSLGGVELFDADGKSIDTGEVSRVGDGGRTIVVPVDPLDDGAYVVTWRVVSADSHPIEGAFSFRVGEGGADADTDALAAELLASGGGSDTAAAMYAVVRSLVFVGVAGFVGLLGFVLVVWPGAAGIRSMRKLLWAGWSILGVATALAIGLQGVIASAGPLGDVVDPSVISDVLDTRFGQLALLRLAVLSLSLPLLLNLPDEEDGRLPAWWRPAAVISGFGILVTVALAGHAGAGRWVPLAATVDIVHLGAMSLWLGGLAVLLAVVLPRRQVSELREVVPRFSTVAFASVVALVVTGSVQSYRQVGSIDALTSTTYGRVLMLKLVMVGVLVALAALSRVIVRRGYRVAADPGPGPSVPLPVGPGAMVSEHDAEDAKRLERSVMGEVIIGMAVLVVSAILMNVPPAYESLEKPWSAELHTEELRIDVSIDPASAGPTDIHVYTLTHLGQPQDVEDVEMSLTLPDNGIGPIDVPLEPAGPGHFTVSDFDLPIAGVWDVEVKVLLTQIDLVRAETQVPVR